MYNLQEEWLLLRGKVIIMKFVSLFSGIGAFEQALKNLGVDFDLVAFCECDKFATKSYCAIHGVDETKNLGDITKVDAGKLPKDIDLITYGFPCQDISISGDMRGLFNEDGTHTRSGLFFEALRIIEATKPSIAIAENVKNLTSKRFAAQFQIVLKSLEAAGYNNYWAVLNAKDYGVPQNRERVFIVSIRKDIDPGHFSFPNGCPLEKRLKDVLDDVVDEKYYLDGKYETVERVNDNYSLLCGGVIGRMHDISRRVYSADYVSPSLHTCGGGNLEPKVAVAMRGRYNSNGEIEQHIEVSDREYANALTTVQKDSMVRDGERYRKLIPKECFRLMGFDDESFHRAETVNSETQLYKQAGNSIVVNVLMAIFKELLIVLEHTDRRKWLQDLLGDCL